MQDFVFGGIEADPSRRLETERARWQGIRHFHEIHPLDPKPGQPVTLTVYVGENVHVNRVSAYVTFDGAEPAGKRGLAINGMPVEFKRVDVHWQPMIWDYVEVWQAEIPGQPDGTLVQYRIEGWHSRMAGLSSWSREMNLEQAPETQTLYGYHVDELAPPDWARHAAVYQIFVDRFARGLKGQPVKEGWLSPAELSQFMGGDLLGVTAQLDYIASLGVNAIWLSPIFTTSSYHGYDTVDFYEIDPRFGTKNDLKALVKKAHQHGLRVILDFVANHTSVDFPPFQEALKDPESPFRRWFTIDPAYKNGYRAFFDVASMPQLNTDNPEVRQFLIDAACYWLREFDIDGYRLDYAAGPGHRFWSEFRAACKQTRPDCWLVGEVTRAGDFLRTYVGRLDGCLDFSFTRAVRRFCAGNSSIRVSQFAAFLRRHQIFFPSGFSLAGFLDNHDMNRFLWVAENDKARLRLAAGLLFALGDCPILYYGTEVGLSQPQGKSPHMEESRHPMLWGDKQDKELLTYFRWLIEMRREHPALVNGDMRTLTLDDERGIWLIKRVHDADQIFVVINGSDKEQTVELPDDTFENLWNLQPVGQTVTLAPYSLALLRPT